MSEGLAWPPTKEDLLQLYVGRKLSAARIADSYGLKSANPKSAETLILYHLRKFGIARRDRAEHIRKVTKEMVDGWVETYKAGESLKQIAGRKVDTVTVWNHLKKRGVTLRDRVEAQIKAVTKYEKRPFQGCDLERAYLTGLRYGDLHVVRHGRAIRVRVSTTHPAMAELFDALFSPYGHVLRYPRANKLVGYEWSLECDLDNSFDFLLRKPLIPELAALSKERFIAFLAGIFDAEGTLHLHKKRSWHNPEAWISNSEPELIEILSGRLRSLGYHASVRKLEQQLNRKGLKGRGTMFRVEILRFQEVQKFIRMLPIRHAEKISRRDLILKLTFHSSSQSRRELVAEWKTATEQIRRQVSNFVGLAGVAHGSRKSQRTIL